MQTVIVGAGVSGAFLAQQLEEGVQVFDDNDKPGCRCAWGIPYSHVHDMLGNVGLDLDDLVLCRATGIFHNGIHVPMSNFVTVDKPRLVARLREGLQIRNEKCGLDHADADIVVNATGVPTGQAVFRARAVQEKVVVEGAAAKKVYDFIHPSCIGYAWLFPLDEDGRIFHLGAASLDTPPEKLIEGLISYYGIKKTSTICGCTGFLQASDPRGVDIVRENTVAVGAAAGCVHPLTGEGIYPSLQTASLLADAIRNQRSLEEYAQSVRRLLAGYQRSYPVFYRMLSSPFWSWYRGMGVMMDDTEHFHPRPGLTYRARLSLNTVSIRLRYPVN